MAFQRHSAHIDPTWPTTPSMRSSGSIHPSDMPRGGNLAQTSAYGRSVFDHRNPAYEEFQEREQQYDEPPSASHRRALPRASGRPNSALRRFAYVKPGKAATDENSHPAASSYNGIAALHVPEAPAFRKNHPTPHTSSYSSSSAHTFSLPPEERPALPPTRPVFPSGPATGKSVVVPRPSPKGVRLISVSTLPDQYRSIFSGLPAFNAIQS